MKKTQATKKAGAKAKGEQTKKLAKSYKPTAAESVAAREILDRRKARKPAPSLKITKRKGVPILDVDHSDARLGHELLKNSIGTASGDFYDGLMGQLVNVGSHGQEPDERGTNFMLSMVQGIEPRDQTEAMLAAQMAAIHNATMKTARSLNFVETLGQRDSASNALNKLARTFTAQVEALKRYRSTGEQKVTVEHVTVNEGGQAIVGAVSHRGRGTNKKGEATS